MIKNRKNTNLESPFLLFFCTVILLFFASIISARLIFNTQKKAPILPTNINGLNKIYLNSVPEPDQILPSSPINIIINFKTRLVAGSEILVLKDGKKVNSQPTTLDIDHTGLRQFIDPGLETGVYTVIYKSCTAPGVCDNGNFNFFVNKKIGDAYPTFVRNNETAITINKNIPYPKDVKITQGSSVVWINHDTSLLSIHSDPVMQNNYFPILSSPKISHGGIYKTIFNKPGFYPYHIDLGYGSFVFGSIIVQ